MIYPGVSKVNLSYCNIQKLRKEKDLKMRKERGNYSKNDNLGIRILDEWTPVAKYQ